jgi:hypothetical protein
MSCESEPIDKLPAFGYFTVIAETGNQSVDDHDVYSFTANSVSPIVSSPTADHSKINRKVLEGQRRSKMPEMKSTARYLKSADGANFSDALVFINEAMTRMQKSISKSQFRLFLNQMIVAKISKAQEMIDLSVVQASSLNTDVRDVASFFRKALAMVNKTVGMEFRNVKKDVLKRSQSLVEGTDKRKVFRSAARTALEDTVDSHTTAILLAVCGVELIAFVIFFVIRRKKTNAFKKAD